MPDTTITQPPFFFKKPKISIGPTGSAVDIACAANQLAVEPDQDSDQVETYCNTYTTYKPPVWTITITALQSFGTGGLWTSLLPFCGTIQPVAILPDATKPAGPDNPSMTCQAYVPWMTFLNGEVGGANEFDLELGVQGTPSWAITLQAGATGTEGAEGEQPPEGEQPSAEQQPVLA